ncbi:hypothetical protein [Nocardia otitidiscaviarum]|uniref:hypothetical protein n=1 Tax=Nocardia otitidiscaviarum TaxID=1823 RepID=UPI002454E479|nr:hypothetical protein [Nocardia otitidiscaviarum]
MASDRNLATSEPKQLTDGELIGVPTYDELLRERNEMSEKVTRLTSVLDRTEEQLVDARDKLAGWRPPVRVIETVRALDALQSSAALAAAREHGYPVTPAVIADRFGDVYERDIDNVDEEVHGNLPHAGWWRTGSERDDFDSSNIPLPVTVLREPKEGDHD